MFPSWMKDRSRLGKWLDRKGVTQEWLAKETGLNRSSISDLCDGTVNSPRSGTRSKIIKALRQYDPNVSASEFW
ncbi:helix-turn-helix domain-containing protein [Paenibacillus sp. MCAF9]|uniref:helix-turn-helix domain-containing protein n=1 Tax=Paenibacillus sp. MCAF9 TaxID=3233046 RepID=UPI003F9CA6F9